MNRALITPRAAIAVTFFAFGLGMGLWGGASATILSRAGVDAFLFGVGLTGYTGAYLMTMSAAGLIARRLTVKWTLLATLLATGPVLALLLGAVSAIVVFASLIPLGALAGLMDATMNAEGARIERGLGKKVFVRFHAGASAGGALGAILGGALAASAAPWASALIAQAAYMAAAAMVARAIPADAGDGVGTPSASSARVFSRVLIALGLVIGVSTACENAAGSWAALLLRREAPEWAALAGLGGAFFSACQAVLRVNADWIRLRVPDRSLILVSLGVAALGFALVAAHAGFAASVLGFAIIGMGTGAIVPCGFALAAGRPGVSAGAAISAVAFMGGFPRLPAQFATGAIAEAFSLATAFGCLAAVLAAAIAAVLAFIPAEARPAPLAIPAASPGSVPS
jgi:hypothetical protein